MNSLNILKQLLETAICASKQDLKVFDFAEDDIHGLAVAEKEDSEFKIVIIPTYLIEKSETLYCLRDISVEIFDIHVPKYEEGETKFGGRDSYFYTAIEEDPTWSFKSPSDVAVKVLSWVVEYNIRMAVNNTAEYIYTLGIEEEV